MGNKTKKKNTKNTKNTWEREPSTENKGIISEECFLLYIFAGRLYFFFCSFKKAKTSCKAMCIIIIKVFKQNRKKYEQEEEEEEWNTNYVELSQKRRNNHA